jgi:predicted site-specific integrase-resolvase
MKLSVWAKQQGLTYKTAHRMFKAGTLPIRSEQFSTGTIVVHPENPVVHRVVLYGRAFEQEDLAGQMNRLRAFAAARGWQVASEVTDVGGAEERDGALKLLADSTATCVVVEHRDRLIRIGSEMIAAALGGGGRQLVAVNQTECESDLDRDFVDMVTSLCVRMYGKRAAKNRAEMALKAMEELA